MNFKNFSAATNGDGSGSRLPENFPLSRQHSIYSLTFGELQNMGGVGEDLGSMNMDELLRSIWTAEETHAMETVSAGGTEGNVSSENLHLQGQGSLSLPRTLSQKTVDQVWRDLMTEDVGATDGNTGVGGAHFSQRQQMLEEMTLEEFLVRAGVVREDAEQVGMPISSGLFYGQLSQQNDHAGLGLGFQQTSRDNALLLGSDKSVALQPPQLAMNMTEVKPLQQQQHLPQELFPTPVPPKMPFVNTKQFPSPGVRDSVAVSHNMVQSPDLQSGRMTMGLGSSTTNQIHTGVILKNSPEAPSLSPEPPYVFRRGRNCNAVLEKVVERRQRRMIKNRESAARSRARKQAYTLDLEAEIVKLKELNYELQRKQAQMIEMQKKQEMVESIDKAWGGKRRCLRRTSTGPW